MGKISKKFRQIFAVLITFVLVASIAVPSAPAQAAAKKYVKSLKVSPKKVTLTAGAKKTVKATVKVNGKVKKNITVKSSNKKVVTVRAKKANRKGVNRIILTAKKVTSRKSAKITVTASARNKKGRKIKKTIRVTVNPKSGSVVKPSAPPENGDDIKQEPTAPPEDGGAMRQGLTSAQVAKEMGAGINLGNTMEAFWADKENKTTGAHIIGANTPQDYEKCWGAVETTKECIDGMKAAGFSTIRIPVYWGNMMEDDGRFIINEAYMDRVAQIINYCRANDVYVVLNIHHFDEFIIKNYEKEKALEITKTLWTQIASRYKPYSDYVVFEGFNENLGSYKKEGADWPEEDIYAYVNAMNQTFVDAVRATGGNNSSRMLIASGYWTNIDRTTNEQFVMPKDTVEDRIMVSVHYVDNSMYWSNQIGGDAWLEYADSQCELLKQAFTDKGIQVFVGECTSIYDKERYEESAKYKDSSQCLKIMLEKIMDYGFVPVLWDVNDGFYSRTECRIKSDSDAAVIRGLSERP